MPQGLTANKTLLQKADLSLADLLNDGGLLVPEQAARFVRILIKRSVLMGMSTVQPMKSPKSEINKIRFGSRVLHAAESAKALLVELRSKPDLSKVTLDTNLFKAEVRLNNEVLEDSIEREQLANTVMQLFSGAVARDMEDIAINSDTASSDPDLAKFDGIIKQATSNLVAAGGIALAKNILRDMQKSMPSEFLVNRGDMAYITSVDAEIDYRDSIANRATPGGDQALGAFASSAATVHYTGTPVVPIPLMPENLGAGTDETVALFCDPKNITFGIQRDIRLETDKDISAGEVIMVMSTRWDVKFAHEPAVVKATGIKVA
jgi:hypothetical protein